MSIDKYELMFQDFQVYGQPLSERTVRWEPMGKYSIKAYLDDGSMIQYNGMMHTCRIIRPVGDAEWTEELFRKKFAINLAGMMYESGYTQELLSKELGISRRTLYKYLHGEATPNAYILSKIAKLFDSDLSELVQD